MQLIDRHALLKNVYDNPPEKARMTYAEWCRKCIYEAPTIEAEPVRHGKSCEYCKGRSYTKKPLTVITRTMKRVEVCFNFCPNCGRDMRATDTNVVKGGADNG